MLIDLKDVISTIEEKKSSLAEQPYSSALTQLLDDLSKTFQGLGGHQVAGQKVQVFTLNSPEFRLCHHPECGDRAVYLVYKTDEMLGQTTRELSCEKHAPLR